jgi:hypothetical protein
MNSLKFRAGDKVTIHSKSTGRDLHKAMPDIRHRSKIDNILCPVGWITEVRDTYPAYFVIAYTKNGNGTDYYWAKDLKKFNEKFLEDDLFEI